ncbi:sulfate ABC transporter permease subunit CysW [Acidisoma silvae]|uniref:Sulfate ABC transporter permease subunit CysW n=1 Tax=Acidisoma silvae TaxID=2802396 RepID=A0A964E044_9PROT|nr:sulfate ABC transporter permease subunit CysW [Acidisoma silvae]MCB8876333.1 sulfate ABC transporter permease subunit CysW [Acidisoma silvae]
MAKRPAVGLRRQGGVANVIMIVVALVFMVLFLLLPLVTVFAQAFASGLSGYIASITDPNTLSAIWLTLIVAAVALVVNVVFGLAGSWALARFRFPGRLAILTVLDLPFSVSPVVAGLMLVLLYGRQGWLGPWLEAHNLKIIFALPGMIIATIFVTLPFVARELIPLMEEQGADEEEAAILLGASGWQMFWRITIPKLRWGLLYGVLLSNARAMGEFGAVSVVSGNILGLTDTMSLDVKALYDGYNIVGSFAVASLLASLALVTLVAKTVLERQFLTRSTKEEVSA